MNIRSGDKIIIKKKSEIPFSYYSHYSDFFDDCGGREGVILRKLEYDDVYSVKMLFDGSERHVLSKDLKLKPLLSKELFKI